MGSLNRGPEGAEMRIAENAENGTPKASRGGEWPLPSQLGGVGERRKLPPNDFTAS